MNTEVYRACLGFKGTTETPFISHTLFSVHCC